MANALTLLQLQSEYFLKVNKALDNTMEIALNELDKIIDKNVYGVSTPWEQYRTFQFRDSWEKTKSKIIGDSAECEISQYMTPMIKRVIDTEWGRATIHEDRQNLVDIIQSGDGYNFGNMEGTARPFWNEFEIWANANIPSIFEQQCKLVGLPITQGISIL